MLLRSGRPGSILRPTRPTGPATPEPSSPSPARRSRRIAALSVAVAMLATPLAGVATGTTPADAQNASSADGQLVIGGLLPQTGNLSFLEPQADAAARLAIQRINNAGGVLGQPVRWVPRDTGEFDSTVLDAANDSLIRRNVDAVIGPLTTTQTFPAIDTLTAAGRIVISPSATANNLGRHPDRGLFFRTTPNESLEARAIVEDLTRQRLRRVMLLARNDTYGNNLGNALARQGRAAGLQIFHVRYNPSRPNPAMLARLTANKKPAAVVIAGFEETSGIIKALSTRGIRGTNTVIQLTDGSSGNFANDLTDRDRALFRGVRGILPGATTNRELAQALLRLDPSLTDGSYAPETYDAVMLVALATESAESDNPTRIAREIPKVTRSGVACSNFVRCRALIRRGVNIDYQGQSGPLTMAPNGDLVAATFTRFVFGADGTIDDSRTTTQLAAFRPRNPTQLGR